MLRKTMYKRALCWILALILCLSSLPALAADIPGTATSEPVYGSSSDNGNGTFDNDACVDSDVPDPDIIRVGDAYYMTSTSMHFSPGVAIMKSYDLVNWEIVNYVYNVLADYDKLSLRNGSYDYGKGSWATSLRYRAYDNKFYVSHTCNTTNKTYFYSTDDIENGTWKQVVCNTFYHDGSLYFEGADIYMFSGSGTIHCDKLKSDFSGSEWTKTVITADMTTTVCGASNTFLEATHAYKVGDTYYVFMCTWPSGRGKQQLVFQSKTVDSGYTGKVIINDSYGRSEGLAQGGIVDMVDGSTQTSGKWMGFFMHLRGAAGRGLVLTPCTFDANGWPVVADSNGKVSINSKMTIPVDGDFEVKSIVNSTDFNNDLPRPAYTYQTIPTSSDPDAFAYNGSNLPLGFEWNHNPDNRLWSMTERSGYLRLTNGYLATSVTDCRNVLTTRTYGPECTAQIAMEIDGMRDGDIAGLSAFHRSYGYCGVKMENGKKYIIYRQRNGNTQDETFSNKDPWIEDVLLELDSSVSRVYFKVYNDYKTYRSEYAHFYYSVDGESWVDPGKSRLVEFGYPTHFDGARFGIFNFATEETGGYVDVDYFLLGDDAPQEVADFRERLASMIKKAEAVISSDYTAASWQKADEALTAAKGVYADAAADDAQCEAAWSELRGALSALVVSPRKTLREQIAAAEALNQADYTADSWALAANALRTAKGTYADASASDAACADATEALKAAVAKLLYEDAPESDYFADGSFDSELWTVLRENKDAYRVVQGEGIVLPTQQADIYSTGGAWENCFTAPAMGSWQVVAKVVYPKTPTADYQQAMLLVWQDEDNYIRMNCQQSSLKMEPGVETAGSFSGSLGSANATAAADGSVTLYYMIEKNGDDYSVGYSQDGKSFTTLGTAKGVQYDSPHIGLFATQNTDNTPIDTNFEYLYVVKRDGMEDSSYADMLKWAAQNAADYIAAAIPAETTEPIALPAAPHGYRVALSSDNEAVISADGAVHPTTASKEVRLTVTVSEGTVSASAAAVVKVPGEGCDHAYTKQTVAPTCTEEGYTSNVCSKCGDTFKSDIQPPLGHSFTQIQKNATCTAPGSVTKTCSRCGKQEVTVIPALGHDYKKTVTAPTCTADGYTTYACTRCDFFYQEDAVAALGHDYKQIVTAPTCEAAGYTTYTCTRCAFTYQDDEVAALGHDYKDGVCTRCGKIDPEYKKDCDGGDDCPSKDFTDVPASTDWAHAGIDYCMERKLMNGLSDTVFAPNGSLTRAQLVTILYRMKGEPTITTENTFTDVKSGVWYYNAIEWAAAQKVVNGIGGNRFDPDGKITREQIATILYRYEGSPDASGDLNAYPDSKQVSAYAVNAMLWATGRELINGVSAGGVTNLKPQDNATRAQIAAIIMRYLEAEKA